MPASRMVEDAAPQRPPALFAQAGAFLAENGLDPTPANYELVYRYVLGEDEELVRRIDNAIALQGRLTASAAAGIIALRSSDVSPAELARTADCAQGQLREINAVVERSGREARDYGATLERIIDGPDSAVESLIAATRAMVERIRIAEADLRRSGQEMVALRESLAEARRSADTDPLTGLPNRRALDTRLRAAVEAARHERLPLSLAICDIDHFKAVNDLHGHHIGDEVIKFVAGALCRADGVQPFVARYGGEEFVIVFEGLDPPEALAAVDRIRTDLAKREFKVTSTGRQLGRLTFSAGIAGLAGARGHAAMLKSADAALYQAKNEGRNRVRLAA